MSMNLLETPMIRFSSGLLSSVFTHIYHAPFDVFVDLSVGALYSKLQPKFQRLFVFHAKLRISCVAGHKIFEFWFPYTV